MAGSQDVFDALKLEIVQEQAEALSRIARTLESLLQRLEELRVEADRAPAATRSAQIERFNTVREEAERWFWYLDVQREVLGFTNRDELVESYPIPPQMR